MPEAKEYSHDIPKNYSSIQDNTVEPGAAAPIAIAVPAARPDERPVARRRDRLRGFTRRLRERSRVNWLGNEAVPANVLAGSTTVRRRKRKAALAFSAAAMSIGSAAIGSTIYARESTGAQAVEKAMPDNGTMRLHASGLTSSTALKEALAQEEGVRLTVYRDAGGHATVGVGHRVTRSDGLRPGDMITYDQAIDLLERDLALAESIARDLVGDLPLFQHEFDALVDLVYNVGEGTVSAARSPALNAAIADGDHEAIADQLVYRQSGGRFASGLAYRSERRKAIFTEARYEDPRPQNAALAKIPELSSGVS